MARRTSKRKVSDKTTTEQGRYNSKYALTELMMCGNCGSPYRRITWHRDGNKKAVWRCLNRVEHGTQAKKNLMRNSKKYQMNALKELLKTYKCRQREVKNGSSRLNEIFELIEKRICQ